MLPACLPRPCLPQPCLPESACLHAPPQADLDLGNYERFLDISLSKDNNLTTGKVYQVCVGGGWWQAVLPRSLCKQRTGTACACSKKGAAGGGQRLPTRPSPPAQPLALPAPCLPPGCD